MKKKVIGALLAGVMALSLAACGSTGTADSSAAESAGADASSVASGSVESSSEELDIYAPDVPEIEGSDVEATLDVCTYYGGDSTTYANFAAEQIKKKFPNVTLNFEALPQDGGQTIKTRAAAGDLPDLLLVDSGTLTTLAKSGNIIPIDDYVEKFNLANYYTDAIMDTCMVASDGKKYDFPMGSISPIIWYYNKQVFEDNGVKVPENYDELLDAVNTFVSKGITPMAMFGKEPWPLGAFFDSFTMKKNPAGLYALSEGKAKASDADYDDGIQKIKTLIDAGIFQEGATGADFDTASALFKGGKCAMFLDGSWYTSDAYPALGDNLGMMNFYPTGDAGDTTNQYCMAGGGDTNGMAITSSCKDQELGAEIAFLFAYYREVANYEVNAFAETPLKTDNLKLTTEMNPISKQLAEVLPKYTFEGKFVHTLSNTEFSTTFTEEMQNLLVGESVKDFEANLDSCIEETAGR